MVCGLEPLNYCFMLDFDGKHHSVWLNCGLMYISSYEFFFLFFDFCNNLKNMLGRSLS